MQYFAGLDVSMEETHVCVVTRNGTVRDGDIPPKDSPLTF